MRIHTSQEISLLTVLHVDNGRSVPFRQVSSSKVRSVKDRFHPNNSRYIPFVDSAPIKFMCLEKHEIEELHLQELVGWYILNNHCSHVRTHLANVPIQRLIEDPVKGEHGRHIDRRSRVPFRNITVEGTGVEHVRKVDDFGHVPPGDITAEPGSPCKLQF